MAITIRSSVRAATPVRSARCVVPRAQQEGRKFAAASLIAITMAASPALADVVDEAKSAASDLQKSGKEVIDTTSKSAESEVEKLMESNKMKEAVDVAATKEVPETVGRFATGAEDGIKQN